LGDRTPAARPGGRDQIARSTKKEKRSKKERKLRKGKLVETAAAVEIDKGSLRRLFLDDFHRCLKKSLRTKRSDFFTVTTSSAVAITNPFYFLLRGSDSTLNLLLLRS
jgi:hypothetical protein